MEKYIYHEQLFYYQNGKWFTEHYTNVSLAEEKILNGYFKKKENKSHKNPNGRKQSQTTKGQKKKVSKKPLTKEQKRKRKYQQDAMQHRVPGNFFTG